MTGEKGRHIFEKYAKLACACSKEHAAVVSWDLHLY